MRIGKKIDNKEYYKRPSVYAIIEREVLSKVILGRSNTSSESFGRNFSADMFSLFYSFNEEYWGGPQMCDDMDCTMLVNGNIDELRATGKIENLTYGLNETETKTEKGVSQEKFAELCGLHRTYISDIECFRRSISLDNIQKIADALELDTYKLFIEQ